MILQQHSGVSPLGTNISFFRETAEKASKEKETYIEKLEMASGENVFKYVLLINVSALEGYVAQTRIQAEQSFRLSKVVAFTGFMLLGTGIALSIYLSLSGKPSLDSAYLAAISGLLTEFISGVFFYLYNRTLQQMNRFHDKLVAMQQTSMAFLATSLVSDAGKRDDLKVELSRGIVPGVSRIPSDKDT